MQQGWLLLSTRVVGGIVVFRTIPVLAYALVTKQIRPRQKIGLAAACAGLVASLRLWHLLPLGWIALAYAYMLAGACAMPWVTRLLRSARLTTSAVFTGAVLFFLVLPGLLWPQVMKTPVLLVGWDLVLSGYSYCFEVSKRRDDPPLGDCLFFLLVNPSLVYAKRGTQVGAPGLHLGGLARLALGIVTLFAASAALAPAYAAVGERGLNAGGLHGELAAFAVLGILRFLITYSRQSGLASLQIGMLRQLGWAIPERYLWPIFSVSCEDFWRRWNTYVGQWALRYVFLPFSLRTLRVGRARGAPTAATAIVAAGAVATFATVGAFHDAYAYALGFVMQLQVTEIFSTCGVLMVASVGLERLRKRIAISDPTRIPSWSMVGLSLTFRLGLWITMAGSVVRLWT